MSKPERKVSTVVLVALVILVVAVAAEGAEIAALSQQVSTLDGQVHALGGLAVLPTVVSTLQEEIASIQSQLAQKGAQTYSLKVDSACASKAAVCGFQNGTYVFFIVITNNGTETLPAAYGYGVTFRDLTHSASFTVNATLEGSAGVQPGAIGVLKAAQWPSGTYGNLTKGDSVVIDLAGPGGSAGSITITAS